MKSTDKRVICSIVDLLGPFKIEAEKTPSFNDDLEYPLDHEIQKDITDLQSLEDEEYAIFKKTEEIKKLWKKLVEKSIICLRFYDVREPFLNNPKKKPQAYGIEKLYEYYDNYSSFENLLYGGSQYYRDHVIHAFRVWLLGIEILLKDNCTYLKAIKVSDGDTENILEKVSIWTLIALTHDLGYPLEKALEIIDKTKEMMGSFIVNPVVSMDLSFTGVQNSMNDFVLRFVSSKMSVGKEIDKIEEELVEIDDDKEAKEDSKKYVARLQPKYYFKFQKSLEHNEHGIISALIIYKLLIYFLESDYSINEDYYFGEEDCRQFNIRREILRAIASHTCHDIYQQEAYSFSFLLILCDDAQEWGRKYISELYVEKGEKYAYRGIEYITKKISVDEKNKDIIEFTLSDEYELEKTSSIEEILKRFSKQSKTYRDVFRDGQDTKNRNFNFKRILKIDVKRSTAKEYIVTLEVSTDEQTKIIAKRDDDTMIGSAEDFYKAFMSVFHGAESCEEGRILQYKL